MNGRKLFIRPAATFVLLLSALPAAAAERFEISLFTGWSLLTLNATQFPQGGISFDDELDQGFLVGAPFGYRIRPKIVLETSYRYSPDGRFSTSFADPLFGPVELIAPNDRGSHALDGNLRFELIETTRIRPFLSDGLGLERFREGATSLRWNVGGGALWSLRPGLAVRVDGQYLLWRDFLGSDETADGVEVHAGIVLGF